MNRMVAIVMVLLVVPLVSAQAQQPQLVLTVYPDGYVSVVQIVHPPEYAVSVSIPLLSRNVEGLAVVDGNGKPLAFNLNGSVVTVYYENVTTIRVSYYTADLTSKNGSVWSLRVNSTTPFLVKFPSESVIVSLSSIPLKIDGNTLLLPAGNQSVSYVMKYIPTSTTRTDTGTATTTTTPSTTSRSASSTPETSESLTTSTPLKAGGSSPIWPLVAGLVIVGAAVGVFYFRKRPEETSKEMTREEYQAYLKRYELNRDEEKALLYIFDRGGRAKQAEVRDMLGIPKTSAWRMFQRLEKQGLVRIYKKKRENWVELVF